MSAAAALGQVARLALGDFRERSRRLGFLVMLVAGVWAAHVFLPPNFSGYTTLQIQKHRALYGSAYVGTLVSLLTTVFFGLAGFYLVKDAVDRDRLTRVGEVLAGTRLGRAGYTLSKALSNFLALASLTAVLALSAAVLQLVRGEDPVLRPLALLAPFVWIALPYLALVASFAVLFETIPLLRGGFGNIVWFFTWTFGFAQHGFGTGRTISPYRDPSGLYAVMEELIRATHAAFPAGRGEELRMSMGITIRSEPWQLTTFPWEGMPWTAGQVAPRLFWLAVAVGIALLAAVPFDRFDRAPAGTWRIRVRRPAGEPRDATDRGAEPAPVPFPAAGAPPATVATVPPARRGFGLPWLVLAELRVALRGLPRAWFLVALAAWVAAWLVPIGAVRAGLAPLLWIWPILVWSAFGTREARFGTAALFDSAPHPLARQLPAGWLAGFVLAVVLGAPVAARLLLAGEPAGALTGLAGAAFVPAFALACGALSGTARLFEALYLMLWYVGPLNRVAAFDFSGAAAGAGLPTAGGFALATAVCAALAHGARMRRLAA